MTENASGQPLTPRTELALWTLYIKRKGRSWDADSTVRHCHELITRCHGMQYTCNANKRSLRNRGLSERKDYDTWVTEAGMAWIKERIEMAHEEALRDPRQDRGRQLSKCKHCMWIISRDHDGDVWTSPMGIGVSGRSVECHGAPNPDDGPMPGHVPTVIAYEKKS